jgi:hypothetical protein
VNEQSLRSVLFAFAWCPFQFEIPLLRLFEDRTFNPQIVSKAQAVEKIPKVIGIDRKSPNEFDNSNGITGIFLYRSALTAD